MEEVHKKAFEVYTATIAKVIIDTLSCSRNRAVRFHYDCLRMAFVAYCEETESEIAKKYKISRQLVHYHVMRLRGRLNMADIKPVETLKPCSLDKQIEYRFQNSLIYGEEEK